MRDVRGGALAAIVILAACHGGHGGPTVVTARYLETAGAEVSVSETDDGRTVHVSRGQRLEVVLHSTYWTLDGSSDNGVIAPEAPPRVEVRRGDCVPGGGCGAVRQSFVAVASGRANVTAGRRVCGEVLPCRPDQQHFTVTVIVDP